MDSIEGTRDMNSELDPGAETVMDPWLADTFDDFVAFLRHQAESVRVVHWSLYRTMHRLSLVRALEDLDTPDEEETAQRKQERDERIASAETQAAFAFSEVESDYCTLHSQGLVMVWSALNALIDDLVRTCLSNHPSLLESDSLSKLKIPLSAAIGSSEEDRLDRLFEAVEREVTKGEGVNHFESLLVVVNLSGATEVSLKDDLYILQKVRNLLAHRRGYVDRRFIRACPSLDSTLGERLIIDLDMYLRLATAAVNYAGVVKERARYEYGVPRTEPEGAGST
jgi:hypothetical protein